MQYIAADEPATVDVGECYRSTDPRLEAPFLGTCMAVAAHDDDRAYLAHLKTVDNPGFTEELDAVATRIAADLGRDAAVFAGGTTPDTPLTDDPGPAAARAYAEETLDDLFASPAYDWCETFTHSRVAVDLHDGISYNPDHE